MFDFTKDPLKELRAFALFHDEALQNASLLLGGQPALRRTQHLLDDISSAQQPTRSLTRELVALHQLLTLHNAHDPDRLEAAYFAEIDPASPYVEDICLLSDTLTDHLYCLQGEHQFNDLAYLIAA